MVYFREIIGPILAMVAVILTILLLKKTIDFQAYRELDSNYMDVLKINIEHPFLLMKKYSDMNSEEQKMYEQYALIIWNICETVYDRNKVDKTWYPVLKKQRTIHLEWLPRNEKYFKDEFLKFIYKDDNFKNEKYPQK